MPVPTPHSWLPPRWEAVSDVPQETTPAGGEDGQRPQPTLWYAAMRVWDSGRLGTPARARGNTRLKHAAGLGRWGPALGQLGRAVQ